MAKMLPHEKSLYILVGAVFLDLLAVAIIIPLLPVYAKQLGASPSTYGLFGTIYGVFQLVGAPFTGRMSDVYGRKFLLMVNFALAGFSYLGTGLATNLLFLFACRIPVGFGKQTLSVSYAYITDMSPEKHRSFWFSLIGAAIAIGFIIGPVLGGKCKKNCIVFFKKKKFRHIVFLDLNDYSFISFYSYY